MPTLSVQISDTHVGRVKAMIQEYSPELLGPDYPTVGDPQNLTNAEARDIAELVVVHYLRGLVQRYEADNAAESVIQSTRDAVVNDGVIT